HTLHCAIGPNDELAVPRAVLDDPAVPQAMLDGLFNIANFSDAFYTLEAYRRLPEGWAPAPTEVFTDLNMWRKFLRQDLRIGTIYLPSALFFSYPPNFSDEQSRAQIERWLEKISRVDGAARLREAVMRIHAAARRESLVGVDVDRTLSDALRQCARLRAQIGLLAAEHAAMQERAARIDQARQTQLDELSAENAELRERATRAEEASEVHLHSIRYRVGDALIRGLRPSKETLAIPARLLALLVEGVRKKKTR
ncbi:MAG: hypothetical protein KC609_26960, partial [Myxococcales bacterium]|nr:hypothetical protein [Myxococcales bacterium]